MSTSKENELIKRLMRFVSKDAMNIAGFTRTRFLTLIEAGYLKSVPDLYKLDMYKPEIIELEGFNSDTFEKLWKKIHASKAVRFENFLVALNIPLVGLAEGQEISKHFDGEIAKFEAAIMAPITPFDFTMLEGFSEAVNSSIYEWFGNVANTNQWCELKKIISFRLPAPASADGFVGTTGIYGKKVVITGTLRGYTRFEGKQLIKLNGGIPQDRVTRDTDYLVIAANPGERKLMDADKYGITKISEADFMSLLV